MKLGEAIKRARKDSGMSQEELGSKLGVTGQAVGHWENGKAMPSGANTLRLIDILGLDPDLLGLCIREETGELYRARGGRAVAPLYGSIAAGTARETIEAEGMVPVPQTVLEDHPSGFFLRVSGECMNRVLPNGSYAFVDPDADVSNGDVAAVIVNGCDATIKRFHRLTSSVVLQPDSYDPALVDQVFDYSKDDVAEVRLIGRVVWFTVPYSGRL